MQRTKITGLLALVIGAFGCVAGCVADVLQPSEAPIAHEVYPIACTDAFRYAARALKTNGYKLTDAGRGPTGGFVAGEKGSTASREGATSSRLDVQCTGGGVSVTPSGGGKWADDGLRFSFHQIAQQGDKIWPPPTALRVNAELIKGPEATVEFSVNPSSAGLSAVRVTIINGGDRHVRIDPAKMLAHGAGGSGNTAPIAADRARSQLAGDPEIGTKVIAPALLRKGDAAKGFVFYPGGDYRSMTITIVDEETGEGDEFDFEFPS
ncbi:MAG: hypothetical protein QOD06_75 [Candidatus Binatota bacterium]|nr:hypothetical protein [Candidatus Binatota bacterium]